MRRSAGTANGLRSSHRSARGGHPARAPRREPSLTPAHRRHWRHWRFVAPATLLGVALACGSSATDVRLPEVPALEPVPFSLLGSGKVAFERLSSDSAREFGAVYIIDAAAMSSAHILDNTIAQGPALSPDGRRLAYLTTVPGPTTGYDVYLVSASGTDVRQVTGFAGQEGPPTWSPDGTRIIVAGSPDNLLWNAYSVSADDGTMDVLQLTDLSPDSAGNLGCPLIFDNMEPIAMSAGGSLTLACSNAEIDVVSPTGTHVASYQPSFEDRRHQPGVYSPTWSPAGAHVAFIEATVDSAKNFSLNGIAVKVMDADGGNVTTVASVEVQRDSVYDSWSGPNNFSICWMPDGSRLVFNVPEAPLVSHLWVVHADGSGLAQLTSEPHMWDRSVSCSR